MSSGIKHHTIEKCNKVTVLFQDPEGLNRFTEFMFQNKIHGMGFEWSKSNTEYVAFFTDEELELIKVFFEKNKDGKIV